MRVDADELHLLNKLATAAGVAKPRIISQEPEAQSIDTANTAATREIDMQGGSSNSAPDSPLARRPPCVTAGAAGSKKRRSPVADTDSELASDSREEAIRDYKRQAKQKKKRPAAEAARRLWLEARERERVQNELFLLEVQPAQCKANVQARELSDEEQFEG